jgi:dihydroorotase
MSQRPVDMVIAGGRIVDPALGFGKVGYLLIRDGAIAGIETDRNQLGELKDIEIIDAEGKLVVPGLIDVHVHLREPGREDEETIVTGCRAAAAGGFTSVCCMPNTNPVIDNQETVLFVRDRANVADANVYVVGAITKGLQGKELAEIGDLVKVGAVSVTDDGQYVQNSEIMRRAMEYSRMFDIPVMDHAVEGTLSSGGVMNESFESTRLGLKGSPAVAEEIAVLRDLALCRVTNARIHIQHVSSRRAVEAIRSAKEEGIRVTSEACPHHFVLTDNEIGKSFNTNLRVNPPLRTADDCAAIVEGLVDGTIDCIASDHAPHSIEEKDCEFDLAPPGMIGLETTLGLVKTHLIDKGYLTWADAVKKMTINPASIFGLPGGSFAAGSPADVTIVSPDEEWVVDESEFKSLSRNSPYIGYRLQGRAYCTILGGRVVFMRGNSG